MKVGDYVRVKNTEKDYIEITQIKKFYLDEFVDYRDNDYSVNEIIKSHPNIIDLIEVGDYVNGVEVLEKQIDELNEEYLQCGVGDYVVCTYETKDIKSILTKEQFESMEYKVGK